MAGRQFNSLSGGNWSLSSNWALNSPPGNGDNVTFAAGTYTSTIDTGFPTGISLGSVGVEAIVLQPNVTLDIQQSITVSGVVGSTEGTGAAQGLLEIGKGATLTYTSQDFGGLFNNQTLYIKGDGVGSTGKVVFTGILDAGATITMDGANFDASSIDDPSADITLQNGAVFTAGASDAFTAGTIALSGAVANLANIGTLTNMSGAATGQVVEMVSGGPQDELLVPDTSDGKSLTIENYGFHDIVGIATVTSVKSATYNAGTLDFFAGTNGTGTLLAQLTGLTLDPSLSLPPTLGSASFSIVTNPTGTFVELIACFAEGTEIATERGMVAVEALREGDQVRTLRDGKLRPIIWLGHRRIDCRRHPTPAQVWPVRISVGALGPDRPYRDLVLSPDHALLVDDVLIPVRYLVNGETIRQETWDEVTYWHVELPRHDVLYAEGVAAESYLDTGNRSAFANGGDAIDRRADFFVPPGTRLRR